MAEELGSGGGVGDEEEGGAKGTRCTSTTTEAPQPEAGMAADSPQAGKRTNGRSATAAGCCNEPTSCCPGSCAGCCDGVGLVDPPVNARTGQVPCDCRSCCRGQGCRACCACDWGFTSSRGNVVAWGALLGILLLSAALLAGGIIALNKCGAKRAGCGEVVTYYEVLLEGVELTECEAEWMLCRSHPQMMIVAAALLLSTLLVPVGYFACCSAGRCTPRYKKINLVNLGAAGGGGAAAGADPAEATGGGGGGGVASPTAVVSTGYPANTQQPQLYRGPGAGWR